MLKHTKSIYGMLLYLIYFLIFGLVVSMAVFICVNQFQLLTSILNYLRAIDYSYSMCINGYRIVYHCREIFLIIE
jgi:hypothetical protein